ncbi:Trimeric LpxA-like protein [Niveomyces insectorum RCEF 264]|uniref:Trimeric LpxA-like protein n=1 Tax=Niveomyces insectorum RCEF 264 TaxID=1081102 RepID=A0A167TA42_9HYPO|nr:Trimeric LpxA-like protein [Niveomyces insectorum RCEF 264]
MASSNNVPDFADKDNYARMQRGELFFSFTPEIVAARRRCGDACRRFNKTDQMTRREMAQFWNDIVDKKEPLPPPAASEEADEELLADQVWVEAPIHVDYGFNIATGKNVFINFNCTILDTCLVSIGSRTMIGPNVSLFASTHPIDPDLRNGTNGPELGGPITIGEDCWIGGNVTILPNVTIGDGCTIGACSVVTKDIPPYHLAVGSPARVIRKIERKYKAEQEAAKAASKGT